MSERTEAFVVGLLIWALFLVWLWGCYHSPFVSRNVRFDLDRLEKRVKDLEEERKTE